MDGMTGGVKNSAIAIIQNGLAQVAARKRCLHPSPVTARSWTALMR
jgi:hypothetical protein